MKTGGLSENKEVNESVTELLQVVDAKIKENLSLDKEDVIKCHFYKSQVVAGVIYFIKISINNNYYHVKVIDYLPHSKKLPELLNIISSKEDSEITFF